MAEIVTLDPLTLTDLDTARAYLKSESTKDDPTITALVNHASSEIEMHCRRYLFARPYDTASGVAGKRPTLKRDGDGSNIMFFPEYPINTVTSMTQRDDNGTTTRLLDITGLRILTGHQVRVPFDSFARGKQNIEIVCNLGYAAGTNDRERRVLEAACLRWVQVLWQDRDAAIGRGTSFGVAGESVQLIQSSIPPDIEQALKPFVRLV
jgi:hypothetical protein